jgi:hypothetical protein
VNNATQIGWTWWVLLAGASSVVVGQGYLLLQLRQVGGAVRSMVGAYRRAWESVITIIVIDLVGGLALAVAFAFFGVSQPDAMVQVFHEHPAAGWILLGCFGPVISDRAFAGSFIRGKFDPLLPNREAHPESGSSAWRLRNEAIATLVDSLWRIVRDNSFNRYLALKSSVKRTMSNRRVKPSDVVFLFSDFYSTSKSKPSDFVSSRLERLSRPGRDIDRDRDCREEVLQVAVKMLHEGHWDPIEVLVASSIAPAVEAVGADLVDAEDKRGTSAIAEESRW